MPENQDVVIAGGGPGGYTAAALAARSGRRVLLVDEAGTDGLGGACLHVGCIPSKALIELAGKYHSLAPGAAMGLITGTARIDMGVFQDFKRGVIERLSGGVAGMMKSAGVEVRRGRLRFTGPRSAVVNDGSGGAQFMDFKSLVLATGSRPTTLTGLPVDGARILDSSGALAMTELPSSVAIVGGGYIGVELGMAFARLGVTTAIVEATSRLIPGVDEALVRPVMRRLGELGVTVMVDTLAEDVDDDYLKVRGPGGQAIVAAEKVIVAVGRVPNTDDLGLEDAGLSMAKGGLLEVAPDRRLSKHVAAIGDITPGPALAHKASAEAAVAVEALAGERVAFEPLCIPAVVFSDPEIATVGLTESEARAQGIDASVARAPITASGRAATLMANLGFAQLVTDAADGTIIGAHLVGPHASELIAEMALAIELGATAEDLALTVHPHPTLSEQVADLARGVGH